MALIVSKYFFMYIWGTVSVPSAGDDHCLPVSHLVVYIYM